MRSEDINIGSKMFCYNKLEVHAIFNNDIHLLSQPIDSSFLLFNYVEKYSSSYNVAFLYTNGAGLVNVNM